MLTFDAGYQGTGFGSADINPDDNGLIHTSFLQAVKRGVREFNADHDGRGALLG